MAKLKQYYRSAKIPGLPDTTNITDPQLRLFLDRIKLFCSELAITVNGLEKYRNVDNIATDLVNNNVFNAEINKIITQTATNIVDDRISNSPKRKSKDDIELEGIFVSPGTMTINIFNNPNNNQDTAWVDYSPYNTSNKYKGVVWSVSNPEIATIDQNGVVTALAVGQCSIIATSTYDPDITDSALLDVVYADTITVTATYQWCSQNSNVVCFTEIQEPVAGNCIWGATENSVLLIEGKTEEEAKAASALTTIATADIRKWISTRYPEWASGKKFWRDENKDEEGGFEKYEMHGASAVASGFDEQIYGQHLTGYAFFCENPPPSAGGYGSTTDPGTVYGWAARRNDYANMDYAKANLRKDAPVMEGDFVWHSRAGNDEDTGDEFPDRKFLHLLKNDYSSSGKTTVLNRTGNVMENVPNFGGKWYEYVATPIPGYNQDTVWLNGEQVPTSYPTNKQAFVNHVPNEDGVGYHSDCITSRDIQWLTFNGYKYGYFYSGQLYDILYYLAWTLSPCHRTGVAAEYITVYTDYGTAVDDIVIGETSVCLKYDYGEDYNGDGVNDYTIMPEGFVAGTGEGTYSITGNNGGTYYRH